MRIRFTSSAVREVEQVLSELCTALQIEFQEVMQDISLGQSLDEVAVIVMGVNNEAELNICRCGSPVSVSSTSNFVTGEKSKVLTLRLALEASFLLKNRREVIRNQILSNLIDILCNIQTKRILDSFNRDRFIDLVRTKLTEFTLTSQ